jgi:LuxR family transcriptional regulator, maltose regulon positive regulatory protein
VERPRGGRYGPPAVPAHVLSRPRLFARLGSRPVTVVLGAAGYGKSALVSSWLARSAAQDAVAWLTLDSSDRDPGRLAADLLTTLQTLDVEPLEEALHTLEAPPLFADPLPFVDSLLEAVFEADVSLTLVLDDVQSISKSAAALEMVDRLTLWAPPATRVVLAARAMPRLRLQRLRLEDRLSVVGAGDLAFTLEETAAVVRAWGPDPGADTIRDLHGLTQGWPAGVRMAMLAMKTGVSTDLPLALQSDDSVADYLATEVLNSLDPGMRQFVVEATTDELVCPSLVDAVRGSTDSMAALERCIADGLFLTKEPRAGDEQWFRWHALFAAHLGARRREDEARSKELELRAARWWRPVDPTVAVSHALAAGDDELAGEVASTAWLDLMLAGRADTVTRIVDSVPADVTLAAELHLARAFVAAEKGAFDTAKVELNLAHQKSVLLEGATRDRFEVRSTMVELFVVRDRAAMSESVERGRKMLAEMDSASWALDRATMALVRLCVGVGEARLLDDPLEAVRLLREAESTATEAGYTALELMAQAELCIPSIATGALEEMRLLAEQVLSRARVRGWGDLPSTATADGYLGWLALWKGDSRRAMELLERCIAHLLPNDWGMLGLSTMAHAQAALSVGDVAAAEGDVRRALDLATHGRMPPWWPSVLTALEAKALVAKGRIDEAVAVVDRPVVGPAYYMATCHRANVLLSCGRPEKTLAVLATFPEDRMLPHTTGLVEALRAQALRETGDDTGAHAALERALASASRYGFLEPFLMVGDRLLPLLATHIRAGTAYRDFLTQVRNRLATPVSARVNEWGESLTHREQEVLRYLATDLSLSEIAEAEFISTNTVKTHIAHLYRKLEVANRRAAVRRGAALGLL